MKHAVRAFFGFILESSLWAGLGAVLMCLSTESLLLRQTFPPLHALHGLLLGGVLVAYNAHYVWYAVVMKNTSGTLPVAVRVALLVIGLGCALVSLFFIPSHLWKGISVLVLLSVFYTLPFLPFHKRLRDFGLLKIATLTAVWTLATTWLPMAYHGYPMADYPLEVGVRFLFLWALCMAFDWRDCVTDKAAGIRTLPYLLGERKSYSVMWLALALFVMTSFMQWVRFGITTRFLAAIGLAMISWQAIRYAGLHSSWRSYLFYVDGMMILYGILIRV